MRRIVALLLCLVIFSGGLLLTEGAGPTVADESARLETEIQRHRAEMERLRQESERLAERVRQARAEGEGAASRLNTAELELQQTRSELRFLNQKLSLLRAEIRSNELEINRLNRAIEERQRVLSRRMVGMYKQSRLAALEVLIKAENLVEIEQAAYYLELIAESDRAVINETIEKKSQREAVTKELRARDAELAASQQELEAKRNEQQRIRNERQNLVNRINNDIALAQERREEITRQQRELTALIAQLNERLERIRSTGFAQLKGRLPLPVRGTIFTPENLPPNLNGKVLLIRAPLGANVASVARGEVVFTGWQRGYGNIVIVGHGDRYMTLYAHLNSVSVSLGQPVNEGAVLGTVGETASLYGVHLHFEIRQGGEALGVGEWIRR